MTKLTKPRQAVLVTSKGVVNVFGKDKEINDLIAVDSHMPCSKKPFMYAIAVGNERVSKQLIESSKVFVVNFIPAGLSEQASYCESHSAAHFDKFKATKLTVEDGEKVDCCKVKEAIGYLECEVVEELETGDKTVFIGKVLHKEFKGDSERLFCLDDDKFGSLY